MILALITGFDLLIWTCGIFTLLCIVYFAPRWMKYIEVIQQKAKESIGNLSLRHQRQLDEAVEDIREREMLYQAGFLLEPKKKKKVKLKEKLTISLFKKQELICPLCKDSMKETVARKCDGCGAGFHQECLDEMGSRCTTVGCRKPLRRIYA